jgi:hypothetical protein
VTIFANMFFFLRSDSVVIASTPNPGFVWDALGEGRFGLEQSGYTGLSPSGVVELVSHFTAPEDAKEEQNDSAYQQVQRISRQEGFEVSCHFLNGCFRWSPTMALCSQQFL